MTEDDAPRALTDPDCNLFRGKPPRRAADAQARARSVHGYLGLALRVEMALLCQYVYLLATLPSRNEMRDFAHAEAIARIARGLHDLATGEMRHLGNVCNFMVLWGSKPEFETGAMSYGGRAAAATDLGIHLQGMSHGCLAELIAFETRAENLKIPKPVDLLDTDSAGRRRKGPISIGRIYRHIYFETCMRRTDWDIQPTPGWRPVHFALDGAAPDVRGDAKARLIEPKTSEGIVKGMLNGLWATMTEGEGEVKHDKDLRVHVNVLASIRENWSALVLASAVPLRTILADPCIAGIPAPYAKALAVAAARAYEAALAALYLLWLDRWDATPGNSVLFIRIGGFMSCVLGNLATMLAQTPVDADSSPPRYAGPTFELIDGVELPATRLQARAQALARLDALAAAIVDALGCRTATPFTIDADRHEAGLRRRIEDVGHFRRYIAQLPVAEDSR